MGTRKLRKRKMEMDSSRISVIVPVYNAELYLREALQSLLDQTKKPDEIIVIDDGSTDDSANIAREFGSGIRYWFQENQGPGAALNSGLAKATGDYFAFIGADDLWHKEKLELQLASFDASPNLDIAFGHVKQFISPELDDNQKETIYCPPDAMPGFATSTMLIKRNSFSQVGVFEDKWEVGEFIDWFARANDRGLNNVMIPQIIYFRRLHTSNLTISKRDSYVDYARIIKASLDRRRNQEK